MSETADTAPAADAGPVEPGPGARLRAAREQRGLAIGAVAESLHVAPRIVAAMETNDFGAFDAPVYAKGFLRKYAAVLGLPVEEVLAAYEALCAGPGQPTLIPAMHVAPAKPAIVRLPPAPVLWALAVLALAGSSFWWWSSHGRPAAVPLAAAGHPATERDMLPVAGTLVPTQQPASAAERSPAAPAAVAEVAPPPADAAPVALPLPPAAAPAPAPAARRRATAASAASDDALVIHGVRECWAEIYAPDGARLVYDLVHPGETLSAPGPGPWKVFLGYADGARLTVGERTVSVPGGRRSAATARFVVSRDGAAQ